MIPAEAVFNNLIKNEQEFDSLIKQIIIKYLVVKTPFHMLKLYLRLILMKLFTMVAT